jgi:flagellar biosynthetic protein FliP
MAAVAAFLLLGAAQDPVPPPAPVAPTPPAAERAPSLLPVFDWASSEDNPKRVVTTIEILVLLTILSLAPAIVLMMTSFTRIVIVLSFVRRALATQELPPNQVIVGLALILTVMVMMPWLERIKREALDPYTSPNREEQIPQHEALRRTVSIMRDFMFTQVRLKDVRLFMQLTGRDGDGSWQSDRTKVPTSVLVPAFVISELREAFIMGFALFLPFMIIDMVVAAALISMGMLVLPPILISLPFKILLFILVDGWQLVIGSLVESFHIPPPS